MSRAIPFLLMAALGCSPPIADDTFACNSDADCPPNFTCAPNGFCFAGEYDAGGELDGGRDGGMDAGPSDAGPLDGGRRDGGPTDGGATCPVAPTGSIVGCATITYVQADGSRITTPADMSRYIVAAYVPDPEMPSGFRILSGTASSDGVVRVNVPEGSAYYLRLHDPEDSQYPYPHYFYATERNLDLSSVRRGRDDTPTTLATNVTLSFTDLSPWATGDSVSIESINSGANHLASAPDVGETSLESLLDWQHGWGEATFSDMLDYARRAQLVDMARGDDLWLLHYRKTRMNTAGPFYAGTIVDYFTTTDVAMENGVPLTISGAFTPVTDTGLAQVITTNLASARTALRTGDRYWLEELDCFRHTNPAAGDGLTGGLVLHVRGRPRHTETTLSVSTPYANPFPTGWPHLLFCRLAHQHFSVVANRLKADVSYLFSYMSATDFHTWTTPARSPANIRIEGRDAMSGGAIAFDGTSPVTMTWDPVPGVSHYAVRVLGAVEGSVAKFDTFETSLTMPADTFNHGSHYVFRVYAIQSSADYAGGQLLALNTPLHVARLATGWFLFSDQCGNGIVDDGEECDPGGPDSTASCDADCSLPSCGDGYVNEAAGEACDEGRDGPHCNANCQRPMCGDGHWNPVVEECDGDGCSSTCMLTSCGNGVVDDFEECDDGNNDSGDGCSSRCRTEVPL